MSYNQQHPLLLFPQQQNINMNINMIQIQSHPLFPPKPKPLFSGIIFPSFHFANSTTLVKTNLVKKNQQQQELLLPQPQKSSKNKIMNHKISLLQQRLLSLILSTSYIDFFVLLLWYILFIKRKCVTIYSYLNSLPGCLIFSVLRIPH